MQLDVQRLAFGGDGIARHDGKVIFVSGALPGERVEARIVQHRKRFARAHVTATLHASPFRRPLDCIHETEHGCGGCGFRHVVDEHSLTLKARAAHGELCKLAKELDWPEPLLHPVGPLDRARYRMRYSIHNGRLGLFRTHSHHVVEIPECKAVHPKLLQAGSLLHQLLQRTTSTPEPDPERLLVEFCGGHLYVYWQGPSSPAQHTALQQLVDAGALRGVRCRDRLIDPPYDMGETWMPHTFTVAGHTLHFVRRVGTFGQANPFANQRMLERLHHHLQTLQPDHIVDLYAGSGNLSLVARLTCDHVLAVELAGDGLEGLQLAAQRSHLNPIQTIERDLRYGLNPDILTASSDLVILDPPRDGARDVMPELVQAYPRHILYISCSPPHLARDANALADLYHVTALEAFDMFPRTMHLEMMALFSRR